MLLESQSIARDRCVQKHLDSTGSGHHDDSMRTTVTLDTDVERLLRAAMHRHRRSFKDTLNIAIRTGLAGSHKNAASAPFEVKARPMGLKAGIDPASLNKLTDNLEVESQTAKRPKR